MRTSGYCEDYKQYHRFWTQRGAQSTFCGSEDGYSKLLRIETLLCIGFDNLSLEKCTKVHTWGTRSQKSASDVGIWWQTNMFVTLSFQQAGFERATHEHEQEARDEVHAAVAQATYRSRAEMWDALETQSRSLLNEATMELQRLQRHIGVSESVNNERIRCVRKFTRHLAITTRTWSLECSRS